MKAKRVVKKNGKNSSATPAKVLLPCDPNQERISYQGRAAIGSIILSEGKPAVVALTPTASQRSLTEGYIFAPNDRMEPNRKKGDKLAICRKHPMQPFFGHTNTILLTRDKKECCARYTHICRSRAVSF
jgi:hypothetical protein